VRILANENVPASAIALLRTRGHDVRWVRTDLPGAPDDQVLRMAASQDRLLVTFDKDFSELVVRSGLPASCGVVLFRLRPASPAHVAQQIVTALESRDDWAGCFSVVEPDRVRMIPLPARER